jgi:hypothetical protein
MQHGGAAAAGGGGVAAGDASLNGSCGRPGSRVSSSRLLSGLVLRGASGMSLDGVTNRAAAAAPYTSFSGSTCHGEDVCGVCLEVVNEVMLVGCQHQLCFDCARCIVAEGVGCRPPLCPFCRMCMTGFRLLDMTGPAAVALAAGGSLCA